MTTQTIPIPEGKTTRAELEAQGWTWLRRNGGKGDVFRRDGQILSLSAQGLARILVA